MSSDTSRESSNLELSFTVPISSIVQKAFERIQAEVTYRNNSNCIELSQTGNYSLTKKKPYVSDS